MKYLKNLLKFKESLLSKPESKSEKMLIENVNFHRTSVKNLGEVILPDPNTGDFKLVFRIFYSQFSDPYNLLFTNTKKLMGLSIKA